MNKYRVGIIGAGNIAGGYDSLGDNNVLTHAKAIILSESFELIGFYDINPLNSLKASMKWRTSQIETLEDLLDGSDVICICVPDAFHYDILKQCMHHKGLKAIVLEKPLAKSPDQAKEILDLSKSAQTKVFINYSRRYQKEFIESKRWIACEAGHLIAGTCYYGKGLVHNCSHIINLLGFFFDDISFLYSGKSLIDYSDSDPSEEFALESSGATIFFHPIPCTIVTIFGFELFFEKGRMIYSSEDGTISYYDIEESDLYTGEMNYKLNKSVDVNAGSAMTNLYKNIEEVLDGKENIRCTVADAYRTMELCETIAAGGK